jgi:LPXTG cell wall anchor motif
MRKLVSALAVTAGLTLLAAPAQAQEGGDYPPRSGRLTASESTISPGERFSVSGSGAKPGATVTFTLERSAIALGGGRAVAMGPQLARLAALARQQARNLVSLGSITDADGQFSATFTMPAGIQPGVYTLTASSGGGILAVMTLRVITLSGIGGLPFTGANVLPGLAAGAALIVAGGVLLLSLKRRRPAV